MNSMKRALFGSKNNSKGDKIKIKGTTNKDRSDDATAMGSIKVDGSVCDDGQSAISKQDAQSIISRQDADDLQDGGAVSNTILIKLDSKRKKKNRVSAILSETTDIRDDDVQSRSSVPKTAKNRKKEGDRGRNGKAVAGKIVIVPSKPKLPADYYTSIIVQISTPVRRQQTSVVSRFYELIACY